MLKQKVSPKLISLIFSILIICFAIGFYVFGWTEPTDNPPQNNIDIPINVSADLQTKEGPLTLGDDLTASLFVDNDNSAYYINPYGSATGYSVLLNGKVGIGTTDPGTNKLKVEGGLVKATGGLIIEVRDNLPASPETGRIFLLTGLAPVIPPIPIRNCGELENIKNNLSGNYYLTKDIDCSAFGSFSPIGIFGDPFLGKLDGRGHTISDLFIDLWGVDNVGLFGVTRTGSEIKNLGLENVDIAGGSYVGALVGYKRGGTITNCYSTGTVTAGYCAGGLVGINDPGLISGCYSTADVTTGGAISGGGLVGYNYAGGVVINSYSRGNVIGNQYTGGFVGHGGGRIENCYSTGGVVGGAWSGGFIGNSYTGSYIKNFWNTESEFSILPEGVGSGTGCTVASPCEFFGRTTAQMKQQATFINWDFDNVWGIDEGSDYPYLLWQVGPFSPSPIDIGLRAYNGAEIVAIAVEPEGTLTSPLRIAANGIVFGVLLVDPGDPDDSGVRIQIDSTTTKALRKF